MFSFNKEQLAQIIEEVLKDKLTSELEQFKERVFEILAKRKSDELPEFITRKELAGILGVSIQTLIEWDKKGYIKPIRFGSRVRYNLQEVLERAPF